MGDYLNTEELKKVLKGMMGKDYTPDAVRKVNEVLPYMIKEKAHSTTLVNLYYSEKDHTYKDHIVDLKRDLDAADIKYTVTTDNYVIHGENGQYFSKHLKERFC